MQSERSRSERQLHFSDDVFGIQRTVPTTALCTTPRLTKNVRTLIGDFSYVDSQGPALHPSDWENESFDIGVRLTWCEISSVAPNKLIF